MKCLLPLLAQRVIINSSCRHVFESNGGTGKQYRKAVICINTGGQVLSPFPLFAGKNLISSWREGSPEGAHYGVTRKIGFQGKRCFNFFLLKNLFLLQPGMNQHANV